MKLQTFEEYLQEAHMENYHGTDDVAPDAYEAWITNMQADDLIQHGQMFGLLQYKAGLVEGHEVMNGLIQNTLKSLSDNLHKR